MTDDVNYEYTLTDKDGREFVFTGHCIAESSSQREVPRPRWTDVRMYVTQAGTYVVHVVGMTRVPGERPRGRVYICETATAAVEALHQVDGDGIRYLTRTAKAAITQAGAVDPNIRAAFMMQRVA